ncbi:MAG: hypothetical protein HY691_05030 [Chloroflexi bacterium]|nr:hypothetical protein [Chloroflexota bacterium]
MLGEKVGENRGKVTTRRVLPTEGGGPKVEVSFQELGTLLGIEARDLGTYQAEMRPDGTLIGAGQGVTMGAGGEAATWVGQGVGKLGPGGSTSFRGAIYYYSAAPKWARLNAVALVFEYDEDAEGNTHAEFWEWK